MMKLRILALLILTSYITLGQVNNLKTNQLNLPIFDKLKQYPEKSLQLIADTTYIPLETSANVLLDKGAHIYHVSDNHILITNWKIGDVFIFDMTGKCISHCNHKGGIGYKIISYAAYDEENKEVFILDKLSKKIHVFSDKGISLRTIACPANLNITKIFNYDNESLLVFHEYRYGTLKQKKPYMFLSKNNGEITSKLNITLSKANPTMLVSDGVFTSTKTYSGNSKFGDEFILTSTSCDTIYRLSKDKKLTPLFVQTPSVFSEPPISTVISMKTDNMIVLATYRRSDLKNIHRMVQNGEKPPVGIDVNNILYDFRSNQFFDCKNWRNEIEDIDIPKNMTIRLLQAHHLKAWLKRGILKGELKKIAVKIDIADNPIVRIIRFK
ncbi:6-bladed beta-propeller [Puteibacter caeruleilacunae]|nr:6-bladed beta-propeller [Puteibacter caeruleilacunae]